MQYVPMDYLMHMQSLPKVGRKVIVYGIVSAAAIAGGLAWLIA